MAPAPTLFQAQQDTARRRRRAYAGDYNYKYDWLRPTLEEIVDTYTKLYGKESRESDIESDGFSAAEEVEEDGKED